MKESLSARRANPLTVIVAFAASMLVAGAAGAVTPRIDESQLLDLGFKVLVATTTVQQEWVKNLPPGRIRPMQRNGKKFFIYPDASKNQIYVGGPKEYEAYRQLHPDGQQATQEAANRSATVSNRMTSMRKATARDLSDPFLGASWADLGW